VGAERIRREFIGGVNHINYNQDNGINAFAGALRRLLIALCFYV